MKRLFSWFAALMICVVAFGDETNWEFSSEYVEINGMRYRLDANNKVAQFLTGDYEMGETVDVPETVVYDNAGYTVCSVAKESWRSNRKVKTIILPATIKEISDEAIYNLYDLQRMKIKASQPPTVKGTLHSSPIKIDIPAGSIHAYRIDNSEWNNHVLVDGEGISVFVTLTTAGTLAEEIIKKADYLQEVNRLSIAGPINNIDFTTVKDNMPNLLEIDLSEAECESLPESWMSRRWALEKISLPETLKSIGSYCFYECKSLETLVLKEGLTSVEGYAFRECTSLREASLPSTLKELPSGMFYECASLKTVNLPEGLVTIGYYTFYNTAIQEIAMPSTVKTIGNSAFSQCKSLSKIALNEGLTFIKGDAFYSCESLEEIELPVSLEYCDNSPFNSCKNLKKITVKAIVPAYVNSTCPISNVDFSQVTLYVPEVSLSAYKSTPGWSDFYTINRIDGFKPQTYVAWSPFSLSLDTDEREEGYNPDMSLHRLNIGNDVYFGAITTSGNGALALNRYTGYYDYERMSSRDYDVSMTSLVNNITMTAKEASTTIKIGCNRWTFISLPYDVDIRDIKAITEGRADFVIRRYSGENRALGDLNYTWIDVPADGTMKAYEGYIINARAYRVDGNSIYECEFEFPSSQTASLSNLMTKEKAVVGMNEYASEFAQNRNWNLVGNPYPCYYDTRNMNITTPITVWNVRNQRYEAYSPVDDNYVLMPGEAFFIQRPEELSAITFELAGRQITRTAQAPQQMKAAKKPTTSREVFNIYWSDESGNRDRTRVVLNENASAAYEMDKDAAKFITTDNCQIYSVGGDASYAINERPVPEESVQLMAYCPKAGTYTLSLDGKYMTKVTLTDNETGKTMDLTDGATYQFECEKGYTNRFSLSFGDRDATGIDISKVQKDEDAVYTISGTKVDAPRKDGIYIVNGKKVVVKK